MKSMVVAIALLSTGHALLGQDVPEACRDDKTLLECWNHFVPSEMPTASSAKPQASAEAMTQEAAGAMETAAAQSPTGVDTSGLNLATTARKFTNLVDIAALFADSDEDGVLTFNLNFLLPFQDARDNNFQLQAVVDTEPELWKPLEMALAEDQRATLSKQLGESVGDFDDFKLELTYRPVSARVGRGFKQYRDRFSSLFSDLEARVRELSRLDETKRFLGFLQASGPKSDDVETFEQVSEEHREGFRSSLIAAARNVGDYQAMLRTEFKSKGLDQFAALINNQPEFQASLRVAVRDNLTGPDETTLRVNWEHGFVNLNRFFAGKWDGGDAAKDCLDGASADRRRSEITGDDAESCLLSFAAYLGDAKRRKQLERSDRMSFSLEYTDIDSLDVPLPNGLDAITLPSAERLMVSVGYGRLLDVDDAGMPLSRIDFIASYEDISDDPTRQDRALATLTYTRQVGSLAIPFGVVWANKAEFLPDVDEQISAHIGLRFSLGDKPKNK